MPVGKKDESAHCGTQKAPELRPPGLQTVDKAPSCEGAFLVS